MSAPFIPLTLSIKPATPANGSAFQRLATLPQPHPGFPAAATTPCTQHAAATPVVSLRRDGEIVTHIRIQCACGQLIELECVS